MRLAKRWNSNTDVLGRAARNGSIWSVGCNSGAVHRELLKLHLRFAGGVRFLGRGMSGKQHQRRGEPKLAMPERKPLRSADLIGGGACRQQEEGESFSKLIPAVASETGYNGAIGVVRHRLAWKILHQGVEYVEQGQETNPVAKRRRAQKLAQALRKLGYSVTLGEIRPPAPQQAHA